MWVVYSSPIIGRVRVCGRFGSRRSSGRREAETGIGHGALPDAAERLQRPGGSHRPSAWLLRRCSASVPCQRRVSRRSIAPCPGSIKSSRRHAARRPDGMRGIRYSFFTYLHAGVLPAAHALHRLAHVGRGQPSQHLRDGEPRPQPVRPQGEEIGPKLARIPAAVRALRLPHPHLSVTLGLAFVGTRDLGFDHQVGGGVHQERLGGGLPDPGGRPVSFGPFADGTCGRARTMPGRCACSNPPCACGLQSLVLKSWTVFVRMARKRTALVRTRVSGPPPSR